MNKSASTPHVFLTRFNLPANQVEQSIFSAEWLTQRMELFEKYTVPSVRAQGQPAVSWIIYLDQFTPQWLRDRMSELNEEGLADPIYLDRPLTPDAIKGHITSALGTHRGLVMTSNLDNDDGLATDYVHRLRTVHPEQVPSAVYLTRGLIRRGRHVYLRDDANNAFSAVLDDLSSEQFTTCWSHFHNQLAELMPAVRRTDDPAWLQVVHGKNVSNRVGGRLVGVRAHAHLFPGLLDDAVDPSPADRLRDAVSVPSRVARDRVIRPAAKGLRRRVGNQRYERLRLALRPR